MHNYYSSKDRYLSVNRKQCRWLSKVDWLPKLTTVYTRQFPLCCSLVQNDIDNIEELFESAELVEKNFDKACNHIKSYRYCQTSEIEDEEMM